MKQLLAGLICLPFLAGGAAAGTAASTQENAVIDHLMAYVQQSSCKFARNGTWYSGSVARQYLQAKLDAASVLEPIGSAEAFIEKIATKSSSSGEPYLVKCGTSEVSQSGPWLTQELKRSRPSLAGN